MNYYVYKVCGASGLVRLTTTQECHTKVKHFLC